MSNECYYELAKEVRRINKTNGFDTPTLENFAEKAMGVITEIDEARYETTTSDEFGLELADTAIRILDMLEGIWPIKWVVREYNSIEPAKDDGLPLINNLWLIVSKVCQSVEAWRRCDDFHSLLRLEESLMCCRLTAETYDVNLPMYIKYKIKKNDSRGYLHGKKRSAF